MKECKENHSIPKSIEASSIKKCSHSDSKHRTCLSKEHNDNEQNFQFQDQMGSRMILPMKSISDHFMAPTISASSKTKKRILTGKNEVSSPTLITTTPTSENLGFQRFPLSPLSSSISESNFYDSGSKPYDPLTNYLSPRPTFRLYDPDKRVKILRSLEKTSQMVDEGTSSFSLSSSSSQKTSLQEEDSTRNEFDDDSDEELDEEKHDGILSKVTKVLLLLAVLIVSTVYISSMNSTPAPALSLQHKWGLIEEFPKIQTVFVVDKNDLMKGSTFFIQTLENIVTLTNVAECDLNGKFEEKEMSKQVLEEQGELSEEINLSDERDSAGETFDLSQVSETQFVPNSMNNTDKILFDKLPMPCEFNEVLIDNFVTSEGTGKDEVVVEHDIPESDLTYTYDHGEDETIQLRESKLLTPWEMDQLPTESTSSGIFGVHQHTDSFSYKIDEKRIILGEILRTCEVDMNSDRRLGDQTRKTESIATEVVVVVGGIALLAGLLKFLAGLLRFIYLKFSKPSRRDSSDGGLPSDRKSESTKEKDQFIEAEYHVNPLPCLQSEVEKFICGSPPTDVIPGDFCNSSLKTYSRKSNLETQQRNWGISPGTPSAPQLFASTELKSNGKSTPGERITRTEAGVLGISHRIT
ncbi:hypothetical protein AQUCO_00500039v1 [Aquilegia coerulea]|uniref:Uncharacterized protein n=1 Tax=Aquilegia coerulea TaxID=218851 RepID=A0A2G5EQ18_AQUCA|nr:hypothetical protein AQUCO_00500039v1 [Aquilegia coerulea]